MGVGWATSRMNQSKLHTLTYRHLPFMLVTFGPTLSPPCVATRSGELRTQKLKSYLVRTRSLNVLPLKLEVGQYIAVHATLTAKKILPCFFLLFQSIHLHFFQNLSRFFCALAVANSGFCEGPQNKIGHPAGCRFSCLVPTEYK